MDLNIPKTTIAFQGGAYGMYVKWVIYSLLTDSELISPFIKSTSHDRKYLDQSLLNAREVLTGLSTLDEIAKGNIKLSLIHPLTKFGQKFTEEVDKISGYVEKVIIPYIDHSTYLLGIHNYLFKSVPDLADALAYIDREDLYSGWGVDTGVKYEEIPRWILREHHSFNIFNSWENQCGWFAPEYFHKKNCKFILIGDLFYNFLDTVEQIRIFLNVTWKKDPNMLLPYHKQNIAAQKYINQDILVKQIINSILTDKNFHWQSKDLTLYSEAYIQRSLRNLNIMLKCNNLNNFPTSTKALIKELE
jgi:hypothetical protein